MLTAHMNITFDVPVERVWDVMTDYAGYARFPGIHSARVLTPGEDHPAGVGCRREIGVAGGRFVEEIVEFEPGRQLAYRIVESHPLPIIHDIGRVVLTPRGGSTELDWVTTFTVGTPLIGPLLAYPVRAKMQRTFDEILRWLKDDVERPRE